MANAAVSYGLRAILIRDYQHPGWNRRRRNSKRLEPIHGWRYMLHRILWGYTRLTYIPTSPWTPFQPGVLNGWHHTGHLFSEFDEVRYA